MHLARDCGAAIFRFQGSLSGIKQGLEDAELDTREFQSCFFRNLAYTVPRFAPSASKTNVIVMARSVLGHEYLMLLPAPVPEATTHLAAQV